MKGIPKAIKESISGGMRERKEYGETIADSLGTNLNAGLNSKLNSGFFMKSAVPAANNMRTAFQLAATSSPFVITPDIRIDTSHVTMGALPNIPGAQFSSHGGGGMSIGGIKRDSMQPRTSGGGMSFGGGNKTQTPPKLNASKLLGGIYDKPILTEVAEAGDAEAIIPINRTARAAELYKETGRRLAAQGNGTETAAANISLTINVAGNADRKEVEAAGQTLLDRFGELMRQYQRREARTAF